MCTTLSCYYCRYYTCLPYNCAHVVIIQYTCTGFARTVIIIIYSVKIRFNDAYRSRAVSFGCVNDVNYLRLRRGVSSEAKRVRRDVKTKIARNDEMTSPVFGGTRYRVAQCFLNRVSRNPGVIPRRSLKVSTKLEYFFLRKSL